MKFSMNKLTHYLKIIIFYQKRIDIFDMMSNLYLIIFLIGHLNYVSQNTKIIRKMTKRKVIGRRKMNNSKFEYEAQ